MYDFIITRKFLDNQNEYLTNLNESEIKNYLKLKNIFINDIYAEKLKTHKIFEHNNIKVYSAYINKKDRIIFFYKDPKKIYLYKIMTDHNYSKLIANIDYALKEFLNNF